MNGKSIWNIDIWNQANLLMSFVSTFHQRLFPSTSHVGVICVSYVIYTILILGHVSADCAFSIIECFRLEEVTSI